MTYTRPQVLIATQNAGKLAEFQRLLGGTYDVDSLEGLGLSLPAEGTESYRANARAKARYVASKTGKLTLGDDSGIEAVALDGRPGIVSARFAGEPASDTRNIEKLLRELAEQRIDDRSARFVCWLALADASGLIASVEGTCAGTIGFEPKGANGFGYDPIFVFKNGLTMAELTESEKDLASHRGNAVRSMIPHIERAISGRAQRA